MKNIKYYQIGYYSMEDSYNETLIHTDTFTQDDIENFLVEYVKDRENLPYKDVNFGDNKFSTIVFEFVEFLCNKKGFKKIRHTSTYLQFGWADIFDKNDWEGQRGNLDSLTNKLLKK